MFSAEAHVERVEGAGDMMNERYFGQIGGNAAKWPHIDLAPPCLASAELVARHDRRPVSQARQFGTSMDVIFEPDRRLCIRAESAHRRAHCEAAVSAATSTTSKDCATASRSCSSMPSRVPSARSIDQFARGSTRAGVRRDGEQDASDGRTFGLILTTCAPFSA